MGSGVEVRLMLVSEGGRGGRAAVSIAVAELGLIQLQSELDVGLIYA